MSGSVAATATDAGVFAERLLGQPLWDHQLELVRSPARYRVVCSGRQSGKSRALAVLALFEAATRRGITVLLVSAGEVASRRLLEECAALASASPLLAGSVVDEAAAQLVLSNGSRILSVPASQRQIRGWPVDLLIVDEAGFIPDEVWRASEPSIIARPGSRVVLCSTPWGGAEAFFRRLWGRGMAQPDGQVAAWHWPSTVSPLVDEGLLEEIRGREAPDYFAREYLAEWTDSAGTYFDEQEIRGAVADYELGDPDDRSTRYRVGSGFVVGGLDWGMARDANAMAMLGVLDDEGLGDGQWRLYVPWLEARYRMPWSAFIDRVCDVAGVYRVRVLASELNGVGAYPTDDLRQRLSQRHGFSTQVSGVWTDVRRKESGFGMLRSLMQDGRLVLPNHPELLKQLRALEFEQLAGGGSRITVPERAGHDDLAMALMQAVSCVETAWLRQYPPDLTRFPADVEWVDGPGGRVPLRPRPLQVSFERRPAGRESGDGW